MTRVLLVLSAIVVLAAGCTTTVETNPLSYELSRHSDRKMQADRQTQKTIAIVEFEDERVLENSRVFSSMAWNILPGIFQTTRVDAFPEQEYNTAQNTMSRVTRTAGTLSETTPKLLAAFLQDSGLFVKAEKVTAAEVSGEHEYDYVLRGKLVEADLATRRYSYGLGPAAIIPYVLALPTHSYAATMSIEWKLFDKEGKLLARRFTTVEEPAKKKAGFYYGYNANNKTAPLGLYVEVIQEINERIAHDVAETILE